MGSEDENNTQAQHVQEDLSRPEKAVRKIKLSIHLEVSEMEDETKEEIEKKLREDDFIFGDYFQSVNPRREKFAKIYGRDESSDPSSSTTQPQSVGPSGSTTQPQSVGPSGSTTQPQSVGPSDKTSKPKKP